MLTKADDYPIHQTPEPIAFAGTDRNFYDRYFFNGYSDDGAVFFAAALGVYPHLNIIDASFCVVVDGVQHNLHASRHLNMERLDTHVGPIAIEVVKPLEVLRIAVDGNESGLRADLEFHCRARPLKEPRFTHRIGPRTFMDLTRLTQSGRYEGWVEVAGRRIEISPDRFTGTRDRSWGVRPIGAPDLQEFAPPAPFQFYWLWAPLNFGDCSTLFHVNDDAQGEAWNNNAVIQPLDGGEAKEMASSHAAVSFIPGSRHAAKASLFYRHRGGGETRIDLTPKFHFYMMGLGYGHPEWPHGGNKGPLAIGHEVLKLAEVTGYFPPHLHIQAFVTATMTRPDGSIGQGRGVLEQLIVGPHAPSGFKDILDPAAG
ncbi:hypothetical protein D3874_13105 [Oleomonas cavernae]|uniref:Carotenoid 1,2-hydratase n=1 Tax=Oleomonas cavernae TaxID=2320859 RepID=A0A418WCT2_9PROT|nr:hypothetical protein [Oleomonas cavernae]RJF87847.1 hypothetical protein D3874_13105 [Oleomonas cavernae]